MVVIISGGWSTKQVRNSNGRGIQYSVFNVVQFSNGRLNGSHFVWFSIGLDHSKTKLLASLDHFIDKEKLFLYTTVQSSLKVCFPMVCTKRRPLCYAASLIFFAKFNKITILLLQILLNTFVRLKLTFAFQASNIRRAKHPSACVPTAVCPTKKEGLSN